VAIGDDVAPALGKLPGGRAAHTFDARGAFVVPGFVHAHMHLCQTLFRGLAEQSDLLRWLRESIWPLEAAHTEASLAASVRLGACELIRGGVTCVNDMGTVHHTEVLGETLAASGLRAVFGPALMDQGVSVPPRLLEGAERALDSALVVAQRYHGAAEGRLSVSLAPRFILSCSEGLWRDVTAASRERGLLVHTHLAEAPTEGAEVKAAVGAHAAPYFAAHDFLTPHFVGAHGVWLDDDEIALMKHADAALVHCPGSNLKLGSGIADVRAWKRAGIRCGLGSDGAACNNRLDTFHEMSLAAGLARVKHRDDPLGARDVLALATCDGAAALGMADRIGSLEVGKQGDIVVLAADQAHHGPHATRDPYTTIVHSMRPDDVKLTMVDGRALWQNGRLTTLEHDRCVVDANREAVALVQRAGLGGAA
ncbi:MAG: amidohydrolase family protein, partial [Candidatus Eisenbacteria bacterium]|nr:amidohydrolase family protein [Candidatus Eisenbacteria bacterium]